MANSLEINAADPPDGGWKAWLVMVCSFVVNGIVFSIINTFGILFVKLKENLEAEGDKDAAFKCSLVGSLAIGSTFFLSFIAGILTDKVGLRMTAMSGALICTLGLTLSATYHTNVNVLYLTYGLMFGAGASLIYNPSLTVLGLYFDKHLGAVNGFVAAGSSVFTFLLSFVNPFILNDHGLLACFIFLSCMSCLLIICSLTFTPPPSAKSRPSSISSEPSRSSKSSFLEQIIYVPNWKNPKFVIWALVVPCALFGYFVPFVHLVQYAETMPLDQDPNSNVSKASFLLACISITSGIGRLLFGKLSDLSCIRKNGNRIVLQQLSFCCMGLCTMLMTTAQDGGDYKYEILIIICSIMGLFDGCFVTLIGPIAFDLCGPLGASQAIGSLLGLFSVPMTVGPPVAGIIYDKFESYYPAFLAAGIPPIAGSLLMFAIRCFPSRQQNVNQDDEMDPDEINAINKSRKNSMVVF